MNISYEQALRALSVSLETKNIVFNEDLRLEMCLQDISVATREQFLERTIENLLSSLSLCILYAYLSIITNLINRQLSNCIYTLTHCTTDLKD